MGQPTSLQSLLLGSLLTFVILFVIDSIKNWRDKNSKTQNFKLFVKLELELIAKTLEKLQIGLEYGSYYDYTLLDRIKESIDSLEKARSDVIYLTDPELKEKFIDLISDVSTYIVTVRGIQQLFYTDRDTALTSPKNKRESVKGNKREEKNPTPTLESAWDTFNKRRVEKNIEYVEIKRRLDELIRHIDPSSF